MPFNSPLNQLSSFLLLLLLRSMATTPPSHSTPRPPVVDASPLVVFLQRVQSTAFHTLDSTINSFDPKLYLDLSLKTDLASTISAFDALPNPLSVPDFQRFIAEFFAPAGGDLVEVEPEDFVPEPEGFLPKVGNEEVRKWALEVHGLWRSLCRKVKEEVRERPERHTILPLPCPFFIPGSRFREVYYWDSYWVVRGLLASKMYASAKAIVNNLISLLEGHGYVLNGARSYYNNRSQPPLLSSMIMDIYNRTCDKVFVEKALPSLLKEHEFWNAGIHKVLIQDAEGFNHSLCRYYAMWNKPRPESATMDEHSASTLPNDCKKKKLYREVASAAESGWDFSSRWMSDPSDFTTMSTTNILPVDLNIFLIKMEHDIAFFAEVVGDESISKKFTEASRLRWSSFNAVFWNDETNQWHDYWFSDCTKCQKDDYQFSAHNKNKRIFASNFVPLWIESCSSDKTMVEKVMKSFQNSGLLCEAGIATSLLKTGQQWDFPNGWAPLEHMIIEGLAKSESEEARKLAEDIAIRWIRANYAAFKETGAMHEKLDVESCGGIGGGGEYEPQTGFGWSNGVVLALLEEFGWPKDRSLDCNRAS